MVSRRALLLTTLQTSLVYGLPRHHDSSIQPVSASMLPPARAVVAVSSSSPLVQEVLVTLTIALPATSPSTFASPDLSSLSLTMSAYSTLAVSDVGHVSLSSNAPLGSTDGASNSPPSTHSPTVSSESSMQFISSQSPASETAASLPVASMASNSLPSSNAQISQASITQSAEDRRSRSSAGSSDSLSSSLDVTLSRFSAAPSLSVSSSKSVSSSPVSSSPVSSSPVSSSPVPPSQVFSSQIFSSQVSSSQFSAAPSSLDVTLSRFSAAPSLSMSSSKSVSSSQIATAPSVSTSSSELSSATSLASLTGATSAAGNLGSFVTPVAYSTATLLESTETSRAVATPSSVTFVKPIQRHSSRTHHPHVGTHTRGLRPVTFTTTLYQDSTTTITSCWTSYPSSRASMPSSADATSAFVHTHTKISSSAQRQSTLKMGRSSSASTDMNLSSQTHPQAQATPTTPAAMYATLTQGATTLRTTVTVSLETTLTTSEIQTVTDTVTVTPNTRGTVKTSLQTMGNPSKQPFNTTVIPTPSSTVQPVSTGTARISTGSAIVSSISMAASSMSAPSGDIFVPVNSGGPPPAQITTRGPHPVPTQGIVKTGPIETNKFYANFFLGTRNASAFTQPYSVAWAAGQGATGSWGIAVSHVLRSQTVYGPGSPPQYFINPLGLQSIILSARQLGSTTSLTMSDLTGFSANINLAPTTGATSVVTYPLVQGMAFVTAIYKGATPLLQSSLFFRGLTYGGAVSAGVVRYSATLMDGTVWYIYLKSAQGSTLPTLTLASNQQIVANRAFSGTVQVAKCADYTSCSNTQPIYDASAGVYPVSATLSGTASGTRGSYTLSWTKAGATSKKLLMFALPHHVSSFSSGTAQGVEPGFLMQTTTKGNATAVVGDAWTMEENLPTSMQFAPWSPTRGSVTSLPPSAVTLINNVAAMELSEDMEAQTDLNSMYFAGKALAKFATIVYTANNLGHSTGTASAGLAKLKQQFSRFVNNTQIYPLVYDSTWGGAVSSATYVTGDPNADFGNTYYNDHHFHYGYFVYAAAVIGFLDPTWLQQGSNKAWVQMLIRDYANPVTTDGYFPFSRMFDWYNGHSWAAGLFESFDGKNQESSSEDAFASYAIKMWGRTIGDAHMQARGNLMLAIQARSFNDYYYMQSSNTIQPPSFVPNKAAGILFDNKIDHTTYFGSNIEYIEGIHMLPLNPSSPLTRDATFVSQEWNMYFSNGRANTVAGGWRGILYANLAIIDPTTSYNFFAQSGFDSAWLDSGASRTWYLAFAAGLGGVR